jgi:hypothetical protein
MVTLEEWPECTRKISDACDGEVDPRRWNLGLHWCLACASPRKEFCSVPMHKSNLVLVTNKEELKYVGVQTPRE